MENQFNKNIMKSMPTLWLSDDLIEMPPENIQTNESVNITNGQNPLPPHNKKQMKDSESHSHVQRKNIPSSETTKAKEWDSKKPISLGIRTSRNMSNKMYKQNTPTSIVTESNETVNTSHAKKPITPSLDKTGNMGSTRASYGSKPTSVSYGIRRNNETVSYKPYTPKPNINILPATEFGGKPNLQKSFLPPPFLMKHMQQADGLYDNIPRKKETYESTNEVYAQSITIPTSGTLQTKTSSCISYPQKATVPSIKESVNVSYSKHPVISSIASTQSKELSSSYYLQKPIVSSSNQTESKQTDSMSNIQKFKVPSYTKTKTRVPSCTTYIRKANVPQNNVSSHTQNIHKPIIASSASPYSGTTSYVQKSNVPFPAETLTNIPGIRSDMQKSLPSTTQTKEIASASHVQKPIFSLSEKMQAEELGSSPYVQKVTVPSSSTTQTKQSGNMYYVQKPNIPSFATQHKVTAKRYYVQKPVLSLATSQSKATESISYVQNNIVTTSPMTQSKAGAGTSCMQTPTGPSSSTTQTNVSPTAGYIQKSILPSPAMMRNNERVTWPYEQNPIVVAPITIETKVTASSLQIQNSMFPSFVTSQVTMTTSTCYIQRPIISSNATTKTTIVSKPDIQMAKVPSTITKQTNIKKPVFTSSVMSQPNMMTTSSAEKPIVVASPTTQTLEPPNLFTNLQYPVIPVSAIQQTNVITNTSYLHKPIVASAAVTYPYKTGTSNILTKKTMDSPSASVQNKDLINMSSIKKSIVPSSDITQIEDLEVICNRPNSTARSSTMASKITENEFNIPPIFLPAEWNETEMNESASMSCVQNVNNTLTKVAQTSVTSSTSNIEKSVLQSDDTARKEQLNTPVSKKPVASSTGIRRSINSNIAARISLERMKAEEVAKIRKYKMFIQKSIIDLSKENDLVKEQESSSKSHVRKPIISSSAKRRSRQAAIVAYYNRPIIQKGHGLKHDNKTKEGDGKFKPGNYMFPLRENNLSKNDTDILKQRVKNLSFNPIIIPNKTKINLKPNSTTFMKEPQPALTSSVIHKPTNVSMNLKPQQNFPAHPISDTLTFSDLKESHMEKSKIVVPILTDKCKTDSWRNKIIPSPGPSFSNYQRRDKDGRYRSEYPTLLNPKSVKYKRTYNLDPIIEEPEDLSHHNKKIKLDKGHYNEIITKLSNRLIQNLPTSGSSIPNKISSRKRPSVASDPESEISTAIKHPRIVIEEEYKSGRLNEIILTPNEKLITQVEKFQTENAENEILKKLQPPEIITPPKTITSPKVEELIQTEKPSQNNSPFKDFFGVDENEFSTEAENINDSIFNLKGKTTESVPNDIMMISPIHRKRKLNDVNMNHTQSEQPGTSDVYSGKTIQHKMTMPNTSYVYPLEIPMPRDNQTKAPMLPMRPLVSDVRVIPEIGNIITTCNLGCTLDLKFIAYHTINSEYDPNSIAPVIVRIRNPRTTALIFASGVMLCTGATTEDDARIAARKHARIIQKLGFKTQFQGYKIINILAGFELSYMIRLEALAFFHYKYCTYEPELFPGLIYYMEKPHVMILIYPSGKVFLKGAKSHKLLNEAFNNILPVLKMFKKNTY